MYIFELKKSKIIAIISELLNFVSKKKDIYLKLYEFLSTQNTKSLLKYEKHINSIYNTQENFNQICEYIKNNENEKEIYNIDIALSTCCKNKIDYKNLSEQLKIILYNEKKYYILFHELSDAVDSYANIGQRLKTFLVGSSVEKALDVVLSNDEIITKTAQKYSVEKEYIQSIIFQEQRFYAIDDPIADSLVIQSNLYDENLKKFISRDSFYVPSPILGYRNDSSTGIGQIFAKTAITAINSYEGMEKYSLNSKDDINTVWNALQKTEFNIDTIGSIMLYNKERLNKNNTFSTKNLLKSYNGSGVLAEKYSIVTEKYFNAFRNYNRD